FDLLEGAYMQNEPSHVNFASGFIAETISKIQHIKFYNELENIKLNRQLRAEILNALLQFISFHITDFKELKSLPVLKEVLS
ncbi:MAG: DNA repair protein RecO, partial [Parafilimonas sp.]